MIALAALMSTLALGAADPSPGVLPYAPSAWVEAPDAISLLKGRQAVVVRWRAHHDACAAPRFKVQVTAGARGTLMARGELNPSYRSVDWGGYAMALPQVPVTVLPLFAQITGCCGNDCAEPGEPIPVRTFLPAAIWSGLGEAASPEGEVDNGEFLGTDGRGGLWISRAQGQQVLRLPFLGDPVHLTHGEGRPLAVAGVEGRVWLTDTRGIHAYRGEEGKEWTSLLESEVEPVALAVRQCPVSGSQEVSAGFGPCAIGELGTLWCRRPGTEVVDVVAQLGAERARDARLQGSTLWILSGGGQLLRLDLSAPERGVQPAVVAGDPTRREGHSTPRLLGGIPGSDALWLAEEGGRVWRASFQEGEGVTFHDPIRLPEGYEEVRRLEDDGHGRLAVLTREGLCTVAGDIVGCRGRAHGWVPELEGLGWALPGVLWVGDRFLLTAPSAVPSLAWAYGAALLMGLVLTALMGVLTGLRFQRLFPRGPRAVAEAMVLSITDEVGWGVAVTAVALPQGLVLAVDRLLQDLSLTGGVIIRIAPAACFLIAFLAGLTGLRSLAEIRLMTDRDRLPSLILLSMVWCLFLTLWVWPPAPRAVELEGMLTLTHLILALVTGVATLLYLMVTLGGARDLRASS